MQKVFNVTFDNGVATLFSGTEESIRERAVKEGWDARIATIEPTNWHTVHEEDEVEDAGEATYDFPEDFCRGT